MLWEPPSWFSATFCCVFTWQEVLATHSSILAWRIPWTEEPGGLQPMGLQRARHDWVTNHSTALGEKGKPDLWGLVYKGTNRARREEDNRGRDGWLASLTQWTWVWANYGRGWRTGKPGVLQFMGLQSVRQDLVTEQQQQFQLRELCLHDLITSLRPFLLITSWPKPIFLLIKGIMNFFKVTKNSRLILVTAKGKHQHKTICFH